MVIASPRLGKGLHTFGLAVPKGEAPFGIQVESLISQIDVKTTWDDGSVKFAAISVNAPEDRTYDLVPSPQRDLILVTPKWPVLTVTFVVKNPDGVTAPVTWTASLPVAQAASVNAQRWLTGLVVHESRVLVAPKSGTNIHPFLRVRFDVRTYTAGEQRISVALETQLDVLEMNKLTYDMTVKSGTTVLDSWVGTVQPSFTRARTIAKLKGYVETEMVHDLESFYRAGALYECVKGIQSKEYISTGPKFMPFQIGDLTYPMAAPGGRPEFGPYPAWTQHYTGFKTPSQLAYLLKMGENCSGAWSMHITNADDSSLTLDSVVKPTANEWTWGGGAGPKNGKVGRQWSPEIGSAHQPSFAFVPYLITADRFHLDEMRAWAHYAFMGWGPYGRGATEGLIYQQQTRGVAWAIRDISDFIAFAPDDDKDRPYFINKLNNNLHALDDQARTAAAKDPLGSCRPTSSYLPAVPIATQLPQWQNDYLGWALQHVITHRGLGPIGSVMRDLIVNYHLNMFNQPEFRREDATEYWYFCFKHEVGAPPFQTWEEMYEYNFVDLDPATGKPRKTAAAAILPGYAVDARLAINVAVELDLPGAVETHKFIMDSKFPPTPGIPPDWTIMDDLNRRAEMAIMPILPPVPPEPPEKTWKVATSDNQKILLIPNDEDA